MRRRQRPTWQATRFCRARQSPSADAALGYLPLATRGGAQQLPELSRRVSTHGGRLSTLYHYALAT